MFLSQLRVRTNAAAPHGVPPDLRAACATDNPWLVTACYASPSEPPSEGRQSAALVAFRDTADDKPQYRLALQQEVGAVWGLAYSWRENALLAAAYHKVQLPFGPGGPGAIYRVEVDNQSVSQFVTVPNAGPDRHERELTSSPDNRGRDWAGKTSLGDVDINAENTEVSVVNQNDRRIYRFTFPGGRLLGSFPNGAAGEAWSVDARPFGLKY
ncbi:MAG: hypothetical protein ACK2T6_07370 [Anaerolineae bacterium]